MGIGRLLKSLFDTKTMAEEIVSTTEKVFKAHSERFPDKEPHFHLAQTWLSRAAAHGKNPDDPDIQSIAFSDTFLFACLPPPECARALGLYILYKERPDVVLDHPEFSEEFNKLMVPVVAAQQDNTIMELYRHNNPTMAEEAAYVSPQNPYGGTRWQGPMGTKWGRTRRITTTLGDFQRPTNGCYNACAKSVTRAF